MKSGKFPPVVVALLAVMVAMIAGLVFFLVSDGFAVLSQPPMLLALGAMITMFGIQRIKLKSNAPW